MSLAAALSGTRTYPGPLSSLDYHIAGTFLQVSPAVLSVPKGIPGSVLVSIISGGSTNNAATVQLGSGAYVQAIIRGPGFPTPQRIVGPPNAPLLLPTINLVGDYELDSIALVDAVTGQTRLEGSPSTVPVHVFDQVLISSVTSQPLTLDQIQQAGIAIDESNFRAVQFNVSFVLNGQTIPIAFPVVSPKFTDSTELIPADEVEAKLQQAAIINQQISATVVQLPPQFQTAGLNIQVQGLNFQVADPGDPASLGLAIPPIPALMVIPGNIGYLHQFFSVQIFTENGAPSGSGLSVDQVMATLSLPPGPDGIVSTNYDQPGDDPLRFARIGPNKIIKPTQPVVDPGPDGQLGTADDISRLQPGETGQAQFYVEGLQEGLWVMNLDLTANLYGLAAGVVPVKGKAAGSVLVRNPSFSITFTHPDVVRVGEPYTASINILNTGVTPANLVSVSLNKNSISGAILDTGQAETIQIGTILPGQSATATYRMVSERTGQIAFSDLTTSDNSVLGHFQFTMGVDAQGVPLSPDTIAMPNFVNYLPSNLVFAANRVLGQALSIATAAQLPPGIAPVGNAIITRRVLDLAEAGQRVEYGDPLNRVLPDLLRDWQGGRVADDGFDSLLRTSDAGAEWRSVLFGDMEATDDLTGTGRLFNRAPDLTGLGQQFVLASAGPGQMRVDFSGGTNNATVNGSSQPYSLVYAGTNGEWAVTPYLSNAVFTWTFTNGPPGADMAVLLVGTNGQSQELRWQVPNPPVTAVYHFALSDPAQQLQIDTNGDGTMDESLSATPALVNELPPALVAVQQDLSVVAGRPANPCVGPNYGNYGTVVAVVFSKPITQASAGATNSYTVDGDNGPNSVQVQPSGRVALLNLRKGISAIIPRKITVSGVTDVRSNPLVAPPTPIVSVYPGTTNRFTGGVAVTGRVLKGDGSPAIGVPVTLTMYDGVATEDGCQTWVRRVSQVLTDTGGNFNLDFVMSGIPYSMSASDTSSLPPGALSLIMQSTITDQPDSQQLQQLLNASASLNNLLGLLSAGSVPQAVAVVQGLDRAVLHDVVSIGSGREGQTVPFVLRFRGRGAVTGQVVDVDGVTPIPNAAVNLFPDPSSSELGRGVFSDGSGQFAFPGIPLGVFSIQVATSDHRSATVIGLLDTPGETTNVVVSLPTNIVLTATLRGQVFDSDNITPVPNARVFLGHYGGTLVQGVVSIVDADASGAWQATNVPIRTLDVVAVTFDGTRQGVRLGVTPVANQITYANVALQAATTVFGQVTFDDGRPVTNALVAGGVALVRSDANGNFQLQGVPVGSATISAGLERNPAAGIAFPRLGSTSTTIVAGQANYVVVKLRPAGRIFGKVFDAQGNVQPGIRVAIPQEGGFYWTDADTNGNYVFENLGLGNYTLSAPANAVAPQLNTSQLDAQLSSGDEAQILAAFNEAVTVFVGANDPLINGDQLNFRPSSWGYTTASVNFDGANVNADIHFIVQGTVSGTVLNPQGVPIGTEVRLTGIGPDVAGNPVMSIRGDATSDPATGAFGFTNVLLAGPWGLQAASPFYPVVIQTNGFTTEISPDANGIVLQFPPIQDVNGSIAGHVYNPNGSPVGQGVQVHIDVSADYQIQTDTNGFFDTQTKFPALGRSYTLQAFDPSSGLKGRAGVAMTPGITNVVDVHLLSRNSTIQVTVYQASGQPAAGAQIELDQGTYPNDAPLFEITDTNGVAIFTGLWEGTYSVLAQFTEQSTRLFARGGGAVGPNRTTFLTLRLGATGSIVGTFVKQDLVTPVYGAEVAIGNLGFATTSTNGFFEFDGVPVGTYVITSSDQVTGGNAVSSTTLTFNGQTQTVQLVETALGTVSGLVLGPYNNGFVAGASVTISFSDGLTPSRTVTTAPNGGFTFPGSPVGTFYLNAIYALPGTLNFNVSGQANGVLSATTTNFSVSIQLQPLSLLQVQVVRNDGITPALNTTVTAGGQSQDTSTNGQVVFSNLRVPGTYSILAVSREGGDLFDAAQTNVNLVRGTNPVITLVLPGVGNVSGTVVASDGVTPVTNADVTLQFQGPLFNNSVTALSDGSGHFFFPDVPIGPYLLTAASVSLGASENGAITVSGETNQTTLRLGASGSLLGVVVRADGVTPVAGVDVAIQYTSQSQNAGRAVFFTGLDGAFRFDNIPVGSIRVSSAGPDFGGIINFTTQLKTNGEVLNLGMIPFDEDLPSVVEINPTNTTVGVPITNGVDLVFNEALDPTSVDPSGIFIQGTNGNVQSTVTLLADTNGIERLVHIQPVAPLQSKQVYSVLVLAGDLPGPTGSIIGSGPRDLVGRAMAATFESYFATADNTPPRLLSIFPSNNAVQIDPSAVPRLAFDKTLQPTGFAFIVTGPAGLVLGSANIGINGQVLSFVPTAPLQPNATYSVTVSNVFDLAGNRAVGEPFAATFATIDTIGPTIATLRIASNVPPAAGATIPIEADLATNEIGASVRFTQDFNPIGIATNAPYQVQARLPTSGTTTIRAIATDQYGNDGQFVQLVITVQLPHPPTVQFTLISPTNGPIPSGSTVVVAVAASGDTTITNLTALIGGAATGTLATVSGPNLTVQGTVPSTATPSQQVEVFAQATDALGLSSGQKVFSLPVSDGTPPTLAILSPSNFAHVAAGPSFNLVTVAADNSTNVNLNLVVSGALSSTQAIALALTPNTPVTNVFTVSLQGAPTNGGAIFATLTAIDAATNVTRVTNTYWLPGTLGPSITSLSIGSNLPPIAGSLVPIEAVLVSNGPGVSVRFTQDSKLIGTVTNAPYEVLVKLPAAGTTVIQAIATDSFGNAGLVSQLAIAVQTNLPPSIQFTRILPVSGPVPSGSTFQVDIKATGNSNLFHITASLSGAATGSFATDGTVLHVQVSVPPTAIAGQQIQITAQATDGLGQSSGPQVLNLPVSDGTPPTLAILSPPENTQLTPGQSLQIAIFVEDNSTNVILGLSVTGAVSATQSASLALTPNTPATNVIILPLPQAPTNGTPITAIVTATDQGGNATASTRIFWLPGTSTTVLWERQALGQTFTCTNGAGSYFWPNNNNWSQSALFGDPCHTGINVTTVPSNWSTTNYPNDPGLDVVLGGVGGAVVNLDVSVSLHSLTIQNDGVLNMPLNGSGSSLTATNLLFESDGNVITRSGCCGPTTLVLAEGVMEKSGGTNVTTIDPGVALDSYEGTLAVDSGTLVLPGNNSFYTNGAFNVASNAVLELVPGGQSATFTGTFTGLGEGTVSLAAGTLNSGSNGVSFTLPDPLFQWSGGSMAGFLTNQGVLNLTGTSDRGLALSDSRFFNAGVLQHQGSGPLTLDRSGNGTAFENLATGIYNLLTDSSIFPINCCGPFVFDNQGLVWKSGGTNTTTITVTFNNLGGRIQVDTGKLVFNAGGSSVDGLLTVATGAILDLTGGSSPNWSGTIAGYGGGQLLLSSGKITAAPSLDLVFTNDLFQWSGGALSGAITNEGVIVVNGTNDSYLVGSSSQFVNPGLVKHEGSGRLGLDRSGNGTTFENLPASTYHFLTDSSIFPINCCGQFVFDNQGLVWKSGGTNTTTLGVTFNNLGGRIQVDTGELVLNAGGSSVDGLLTVATGAVLDLTGGSSPAWSGTIIGAGGGQVLLNSGTINAASGLGLIFTNDLFQWSGGQFSGAVSNQGVVVLAGTNNSTLAGSGSQFLNSGSVKHEGSGGLALDRSGNGTAFENLPQAVYKFLTDSSVFPINCCGEFAFDNRGLVWKSGGTNTTILSVNFNNLGGQVRVDGGELVLKGGGSSLDGSFNIAAGAVLDLTGGSNPTWAGTMNGIGGGQVLLNSGTINANPSLSLAFTNDLFQWSGGFFSGTISNQGVVVLAGTNHTSLAGTGSQFINLGLVKQEGSGGLALDRSGNGTVFANVPAGVFDFLTDSSIFPLNCCGSFDFDNQGLVRKSGGPGIAPLTVRFNNQNGVIEVDTGQLILSGGGSSSNGTFTVASGAALDLTGGTTPTWSGTMNGGGAGQVLFSSGTINANPSLGLSFTNDLFQWSGGAFSGIISNLGVVVLTRTNGSSLAGSGSRFFNAGLLKHQGPGALALDRSGNGTAFDNLPTGIYDLQSDNSVLPINCCGTFEFDNQGLLRKSGGTNTASLAVTFYNQNGGIEVDAGTLSVGTSSYVQGNGAFTIRLSGTNSGQFGQLSAGNVSLSGPLSVELAQGFTPPLASQFQILACTALNGTFGSAAMPGGIAVNYSNNGVFLVVTGAVTQSGPFIVSQPASVQSIAGGGAAFAVTAGGAAPLGYQWQFNGANLTDNSRVSGSTSPQLMILNLGAADAGNYQVIVTNFLGSTKSTSASLALVPCVTAPAGLADLWTGDGSVFDWVGSHDGTLQNGASYSAGKSGLAFSLDGLSSYVDLGNWSAGSNWTWTAWVNPSSIPSGHATIVGGVNACLDWALTMSGGLFGVVCPPPTGCSQVITGGPSAVPGTWYFVAGTCDGSTARIYVNGQFGGSGPVQTNYVGTAAGTRIGGEFCCNGNNFPGLIEEVALFNRALAASEVQALYAAGNSRVCIHPQILAQPAGQTIGVGDAVNFTVLARSTGSLSYQWQFNGANLADNARILGSQSNVLAIANGQFTDSGNYSVIVTSPGGSTASSNAILTVASCLPAPAGLIAWWPGEGDFNDVVSGFNGTPAGAVTFESAKVGQGFHLVNSAISAPGNFTFSTSNALTIELWFKLNLNSTYNGLVSSLNCCAYRFMVDPNGHLFYDPGTHSDNSVGPVVTLGVFHHAAMVVVGGGQASIYLDGQLVSASPNGVPSVLPDVSTFLLGAGEGPGTWTMQDGVLDEVSIYNRALSAAEIASIYNIGGAGKCRPPGPVSSAQGVRSLLDASVNGGQFILSFPSIVDQNYTVEWTADLSAANWVFFTNLMGNGSLLRLSVPATNSSQSFFRIR